VPIKWQLTDSGGHAVTSLNAVTSLTVTDQRTNQTFTLYDGTNSFYSSGATKLQNDGSQYIFNWSTKSPFTADSYTLKVSLNEGTTYTKTVVLSTTGATLSLMAATAGATIGGATAGALLAGDMTVYVDNSAGDFTADELARVEDAIAAINSTVNQYGVNLTEVTDIGLANIVVHIGTTSAVGGYADGVLGCETDDGDITLILGWNWYAGADASSVGSNQYDFQTIVTHEVGHALGLSHSADASSVMYATLGTGEANRALCTADLNIGDTDSGACGLHAAVPSSTESPVSTAGATAANSQATGAGLLAVVKTPQGIGLSFNPVVTVPLIIPPSQGGTFAPLVVPGPNYRMVLQPSTAAWLASPGRGVSLPKAAEAGSGGIDPWADSNFDPSGSWSSSESLLDNFLESSSWNAGVKSQESGVRSQESGVRSQTGLESERSDTATKAWEKEAAGLAAVAMPVNGVEDSLVNALAFALVGAGASYPGVLFDRGKEERKWKTEPWRR
jgi:hypothetical protein